MNTLGRNVLAGFVAACCLASPAHAQTYPSKTIRLIVPYAPGGIVDYVGRLMAQRLAESLGQNVVVDNRPGAGGVIGVDITSKASADGYTLLIMDPAIVINPTLLPKVPYDLHRDLLPLTIISSSPLVLAINAKVPANSVQELVALAKAQPGKLSFASAGIGTTPHMAGEFFKERIKQDLVHVPYKGSGPAMADLVGGQVQMTFSSITAALPFIKDGRLRGLATTGEKRAPALANLPTIAESGFPGFEVNLWLSMFVPARTPPEIIARLNSELRKALQSGEVKSAFEKVGADPVGNSTQEASAFVQKEFRKWAAVIKTAHIKAQ
ncbi:MAG TPA: tripartite tricarboxylate transporter substrate binding protein [Burkholderiales bacterium]|nr:tripartite tricarboxylate transporter substrate binding protein [Burkholderiales bacterium]